MPYALYPSSTTTIDALSKTGGIPRVGAALLTHRGITSWAKARQFLSADLSDLSHPDLLAGTPRAVDHLASYIMEGRRIVIHGDYDVDGISGTAVLMRILRQLNADVAYYLPNRFRDGYGLTCTGLDRIAQTGGEVVVTVDCGSGSVDALRYGRDVLGLRLIATDHHLMAERPPDVFDVVTPQLDGYLTELSGAGVALKVGMALLERLGRPPEWAYEHLDLAVLGEIADVVPLTGESRVIVREGLSRLNRTTKPGLLALIQLARLEMGHISEGDIGFSLAPMLNAAGRMADPHYALDLLLAEDPRTASALAKQLWQWNQKRKHATAAAVARAENRMTDHPDWLNHPILVVEDEQCPLGVAGLVAAHLSERWHKPALAMAWHDGRWKGSARSTDTLNLVQTLEQVQSYLIKFGGHAKAAGVEVAPDGVNALRTALHTTIADARTNTSPILPFDGVLSLAAVNHPDLLWVLEHLAPFGEKNPAPLFVFRDCDLSNVRYAGTGGSVTLFTVTQNTHTVRAIAHRLEVPAGHGRVAGILGTPQSHRFRGVTSIQLRVIAIFPTPDLLQSHTGISAKASA